jgi:CRP-like cAMP-binding protein
MTYDSLRALIKENVQISDAELTTICRYFKPKTVDKSDYLLRQGRVCQVEGFVVSGCFRVFNIDESGNEGTLYFAAKGWWLMDIDSFMHQTPSELNIQALEESEVLVITKSDKELLYRQFPIVEKLFRIISQKGLVAWQRRLLRYHYLTAKERYYHFIETYPTIAAKLTDRKISNYLGITPEFLSKIKRGDKEK